MHGFTLSRNMLWVFLLFFAATFGLNACSDANNVSSGSASEPAPVPPPPPPPPSPLRIVTGTPIFGDEDTQFSHTLAAENGTQPYRWAIKDNLEPGPDLTLDSATGVISGRPRGGSSTTRTYIVFDSSTGTVQQAQKDLTIIIRPRTPVSIIPSASITNGLQASPIITPFTLPNGTVNVAYPTIQLEATGGTPPYTWSVSPALPNGLLFNLLGPGAISGTPLNASTNSTYTFTVMDSTVPAGQLSKLTRTLTINAALTIDTGPPTGPPLPVGTVGQPYNVLLSASGATGPGTYRWSIIGNLLPASGLSALSSSGVMSGIPTTPGSYTRTYRVENGTGVAVTKSLTLNINAALTIDSDDTTFPLLPGIESEPYGPARLTASGGTPPYAWSVTPSLPASLTLDSITGEINGTPDVGAGGTTAHTFTVQDSSSHSVKKPLHLTITP